MIYTNNNDGDQQHYQDLMNKAAGSVISKYLFEIKKYKIDPTKPIPTADDFYELIKDIASNDKEFQKFTFDNFSDSLKVKFTPKELKSPYVAIVSSKVQGLTLNEIVVYMNKFDSTHVIESNIIKIKEIEASKVSKIKDNLQSIEIFFKIDNELIGISFNCFKDDFSSYISIFEYMINSIDFDINKQKNINNNTKLKEKDSSPKLDTLSSNTTNFSKDYELDSSSINELIYLSTDELEPTKRLEKANNYIKNIPNNALAWNAKGFALAELDKHDEAIKAYDHAIELDPLCFLAITTKQIFL